MANEGYHEPIDEISDQLLDVVLLAGVMSAYVDVG